MNSTCTSVRIPYSTWRLQVLRRLCSTADLNVGSTLPFLHPRSLIRPYQDRRDFHESTVRKRSNFKDVKRTAKHKAALREREQVDGVRTGSNGVPNTLEDTARKAAVPDWNPYTEDGISEMQELVESLRDMAKKAEEQGLKSDSDTPFLGTRIFKRPSKTDLDSPLGDWAPWRRDKDEHENELQSDTGPENNIWAPVLAKPPSLGREPKNLTSPFEHKRSKWHREKKAQVQDVEVDQRLENNIWAQILATSTRLEKGTKARLPKALMIDWGAIRHPESGQDYFLPIELSDLEALRQELDQSKRSSDDKTLPNEEDDEPKIDHKRPRSGPRVRMLPDRLLVQAMTDQLTHVKATRGDSEGLRQTTSKKLASFLIPYRWKHKQDELGSFQRTRQRFNEALGREPDADEPDMNEMAKLNKLQWQPDIDERMEKIMRSRVLIALEALGRDNMSPDAIASRKISTLPVSKTGHLHIVDSERVVESEISGASGADQTPRTTPDWIHGAIFLHIGDPKTFRDTVENWHHLNGEGHPTDQADLETLPSHNLLPPTIAINNQFRIPVFNLESLFGEDHATTVQRSIQTNEIFTPEFWSQQSEGTGTPSEFSHIEPDTSPTDSAVSDSVLDAGKQVLSSILTPSVTTNANANTNTKLPSHSPSKKNPKNNPNTTSPSQSPLRNPFPTHKGPPEEYLILIKANAVHAPAMAREIWQLWRYIGGRKGLHLGVDAHEDDDVENRFSFDNDRSRRGGRSMRSPPDLRHGARFQTRG